MKKERKVEVRFAFNWNAVFTEYVSDDTSSKASHAVTSSRKKQTSVASAVPLSAAPPRKSAPVLRSAWPTDNRPRHMGPPPLRSAYPPPVEWTRNCTTIKSSFIRITATHDISDGTHVSFKTIDNAPKVIEIAKRYESIGDDGYIGEGFTKRGIYVRFEGKEYVITQPTDLRMQKSAVESVLRAEYGLLHIGATFKAEFDRRAEECKVATIPDFYFNTERSIFGRLIPESDGGRFLPHAYFIATRLLPCGRLDEPVKKFTGNDSIGKALDNMTLTIHAFAHFTALYSRSHIVFCDLQGTYDKESRMCLIDPQAHTADKVNNNITEYWDGGAPKIQQFLDQHIPSCTNNWVCRALGLCPGQVTIRSKSPEKKETAKPPKRKAGCIAISEERVNRARRLESGDAGSNGGSESSKKGNLDYILIT